MCGFAEFFADNLGDFFIFLRRFADEVLESSAENLEQVLNFITVYMGNVERCSNRVLLHSLCALVCYALVITSYQNLFKCLLTE